MTIIVESEPLRGAVADVSIAWNRGEGTDFGLELRTGYLWGEHMTYVPIMLLGTAYFGPY